MTKQLLLFIQSYNPELYVNILTHCINNEEVRTIYFVVNSGAVGNLSEEEFKIKNINDKFSKLSESYPEKYKDAYEIMYSKTQPEKRILKVLFARPELSIRDLKKKFQNLDELIIDISGCNKKVSSDIIASYISNKINHICCLELDDIVYSSEWKNKGLSKNYHDLCKDVLYYEYIDFSRSGTTIKSFDRMRLQGKIATFLLMISVTLGVMVFVLIQQQQNLLAQYAAIVLALVTGLGFINDIFGVADRFK